MAPATASSLSFDEIISRDREERERKQNEERANAIFGKTRNEKLFGNGSRKFAPGPSLASRVGISKRSLSNSPQHTKSELDSPFSRQASHVETHRSNAPKPPKQDTLSEKAKNDLLSEALVAKGATNHSRPKASGSEINIRGAAGPYVVIASNFAPGTTAADIESAMVPNGSEIQSCRIILANPTVMAEMVFQEKHNAETVIETFNNKKADGRILHVYMKSGGPSPAVNTPVSQEGDAQAPQKLASNEARLEDTRQSTQPDRSRRRAEPEIQDGRYGFAGKENEMDVDAVAPTQPAVPERHGEPRDPYQDSRYRRGAGYAGPSPTYPGNGYYDRGWGGGRSGYSRPPYSDGNYSRSRYRGSAYR